MKTTTLLIALVLLGAGPAAAAEGRQALDADLAAGYRAVSQQDSARSAEYEFLKSSGAGSLVLEWDPLPNRFVFETWYLNEKDYYSGLDYSYRDVVVFNFLSRRLYHNLDHYSFGADDTTTASPSFTDRNPDDAYGTETTITSAYLRFKTPDFPLHLYANARLIERHGSVQQRFLDAFSGGFNKVSATRGTDGETEEATVGVNSHLGPVEIDYAHMQRNFKETSDRVLTDSFPTGGDYLHNLSPETEASSDTVKIHTSHTGRVSAAATYSAGEKENKDSGVKTDFTNAAGDMTLVPHRDLTISLRYRYYDIDPDSPATVTTTVPSGVATYSVRDALAYRKDTAAAVVRYRVTQRLAVRAEFGWESLTRQDWPETGGATLPPPPTGAPAYWNLDHRVSKGTARLAVNYRLANRLSFRADASHQSVDRPETSDDTTYPDSTDAARASFTWTPFKWLNVLASGGATIEKTDKLNAPLAGEKKVERDRALGSFTFLLGKRTSLTAGYSFFRNRIDTALAYRGPAGGVTAEAEVPYADVAHMAMFSAAVAMTENAAFTAEASRSYSRGDFRSAETVAGTDGIAALSRLSVIESVYGAGLDVEHTKTLGTSLRYQFRQYDDRINDSGDGATQVAFATVRMKW